MLFAFHPQFLQLYFFAFRAYIGEIQAFNSSYSTGLQFIMNIWFTILAQISPDFLHLFDLLPKDAPLSFSNIPFPFYYSSQLIPFLFVASIPLFLADMGCLILIARVFRNLKPVLFWLFNPIIMVGAYIFGRPEIIVALLLIYSFYSYKKENFLLCWISLFLSHLLFPLLLLFTFPVFLLKPLTPLFSQQVGIIALCLIAYFFYPHLFTSILGAGLALILFFYLIGYEKFSLKISPIVLIIFTGILFLINDLSLSGLSLLFQQIQHSQIFTLLMNYRLGGVNVELYVVVLYLVFAFLFIVQKRFPATKEFLIPLLFIHTCFMLLIMFTTTEYLLIALPILYLGQWSKYTPLPYLLLISLAGFFLLLMHWQGEVLLYSFALLSPREILGSDFLTGDLPYQLASLGKTMINGCLLFIILQEFFLLKKAHG